MTAATSASSFHSPCTFNVFLWLDKHSIKTVDNMVRTYTRCINNCSYLIDTHLLFVEFTYLVIVYLHISTQGQVSCLRTPPAGSHWGIQTRYTFQLPFKNPTTIGQRYACFWPLYWPSLEYSQLICHTPTGAYWKHILIQKTVVVGRSTRDGTKSSTESGVPSLLLLWLQCLRFLCSLGWKNRIYINLTPAEVLQSGIINHVLT